MLHLSRVFVLTGLGYYVAAKLGLLLAVPPSNAAAVWPAAGVALFCVLRFGNRALPAILLGGILSRADHYLDTSAGDALLSSLAVDACISLGAMVQAWVGARLVRATLARDPGLLSERNILLFGLLGGPLACVVSPTIANAGLWLTGVVPTADLPLAWATWWIGDAIGVLVAAPILLGCVDGSRNHWRNRLHTVALPLVVCVLVAFVGFRWSNSTEMRHVESRFERDAREFMAELQADIENHMTEALAVKDFFDATPVVSAEAFRRFVEPKLARLPALGALEWIEHVPAEEKAAFEQASGRAIAPPTGAPATAAAYDVIRYVVPLAGNEAALGFDINNNPRAHATARAACESGEVRASGGIRLVQETDDRVGVVFYAPVYTATGDGAAPACADLRGYATSVYRLERQVDRVVARYPHLRLTVAIDGETVYQTPGRADTAYDLPSRFSFGYSRDLDIAGRDWRLSFAPDGAFIAAYASWTMWLVIIAGLFFVSLIGMGLLMLSGRAMRTEELVVTRTRELHGEVRERQHVAALLALENRLLQLVTRRSQLDQLLDGIVRGYAESEPGVRCVILLAGDPDQPLRVAASSGFDDDCVAAITAQDAGWSFCGSDEAFAARRPVTRTALRGDAHWQALHPLLERCDIGATLATPIVGSGDDVLGTLNLFFAAAGEPAPAHRETAERLANIASIGILHRQTESQLSYQARHDALTGLLNRAAFERHLQALVPVAADSTVEHAFFFLDLDQFKIVNDTCGHNAGDELLRQLAGVILGEIRRSDTLARLGGDEFAVLVENCSIDQASRAAHAIRNAVQDYKFHWEDRVFRVGVSIGVAAVDQSVANVAELLQRADAACYMAKELGRNRIHVYQSDDESIARLQGEMQWVTRIQKALEEDRLVLFAQPIAPLRGDMASHHEILVRLVNDQGDMVPPGAFLPAAERYNLIGAVDRWVVGRTLRVLADYPHLVGADGFVSINLSGQSLADDQLLEFIETELRRGGIPGRNLCFEITETATISNLNVARAFMARLKSFGCRFALDDFGSGLSSFGYLKTLNVDYLKIDGVFVKDIVDDPIDHAMVRSINEIGQVMGMRTIAEFVENDEIKGMLREIGVDYAQGYGVGRPRPLDDIVAEARA
ncbi:MAG: EAL domain-containing protein [Gammaproteobacteria bacterium]